MPGVRIVTDSSCDLTNEQATALGIEIVPLTIRFGTDEFVDREELSAAQFYERLGSSATLPETAAPAPGQFDKAFRKMASEGADGVVCINLSSGLSATMQSAQNGAAAVKGDVDVRIVDSRSVTLGLGSQVLRVAEAARDGADLDSVQALATDMAARTHVYGTLNTLEYLKKGGRIGNAQALLGSMLSIKPLVDISSGVTEEAGRARTRKKAIAWLADKVLAEPKLESLCVIHGQTPDDAEALLSSLAVKYPRDEILVGVIGAVIGSHGGPGVLGVAYQSVT